MIRSGTVGTSSGKGGYAIAGMLLSRNRDRVTEAKRGTVSETRMRRLTFIRGTNDSQALEEKARYDPSKILVNASGIANNRSGMRMKPGERQQACKCPESKIKREMSSLG